MLNQSNNAKSSEMVSQFSKEALDTNNTRNGKSKIVFGGCVWGLFIVGIAHFWTKSNLIWSIQLALSQFPSFSVQGRTTQVDFLVWIEPRRVWIEQWFLCFWWWVWRRKTSSQKLGRCASCQVRSVSKSLG